ncbi:MAG TPA: SHOCT domain-containing protein [Noviherbaspirillum sp.]
MNKAIREASFAILRAVAGTAACAALLAQPAAAATGTRYVACASCAPKDLAWGEGEFDQVHFIAAPADARNLHPQELSVEALAKALAGLRLANSNQPLFDADAAMTLAQGLAKALAKAGPQQDAGFLVTSRPGGGVLATRLGNSGRAFVDARGLNLIVAEAHVEFVGKYRATRMERPFDFGSRAKASSVSLVADHLVKQRNDWVVVPLNAPAAADRGVPAPTPVQPAAPAERNEQYYQAQEARLKALKRLREQDLIDEKEYQEKRREILKAW